MILVKNLPEKIEIQKRNNTGMKEKLKKANKKAEKYKKRYSRIQKANKTLIHQKKYCSREFTETILPTILKMKVTQT